ncbi:MAG: choice-of-anchor L domain-containing protein [Propionibacteriaceae bacterium]|jgi:hypothetical protein|nr:choice-of-anchor L domain-containing protein [Propionibacteriaceae bacterium]
MKIHRLTSALAVTVVLSAAVFTTGIAQASPGQVVTNLNGGTITAEDLAHSLVGDTTVISNATVTGSSWSIGTFSGFADIGVDSGVALSTGQITDDPSDSALPGPNTSGGTSWNMSRPGDADLAALLPPGSITYDAISLEFDFVAESDLLQFQYVFGSDEYTEYVNSSYTDVFGLFVNGVNCAVIGPANDIISINTVNNVANAAFYRDNPPNSGNFDTGLDGLTTVLTCQAPVNPGVVNHIKFAIADVYDHSYDSIVLIKGGSFITNFATADDDTATTPAETAVSIPVTANDTGADLVVTSVTPPAHGTAVVNGVNVVYTPEAGYSGPDAFTYTVESPGLAPATANVTVTVTPTATNDSFDLPHGSGATVIDVLANDKGSTLTLTSVGTPGHGTAVIDGGKITYTPDDGFSGTDTFTYVTTDAAGQSVTATVAVKVASAIEVQTGGRVESGVSPLAGLAGLFLAAGVFVARRASSRA